MDEAKEASEEQGERPRAIHFLTCMKRRVMNETGLAAAAFNRNGKELFSSLKGISKI